MAAPTFVAHADWSVSPAKRWVATARRVDDRYVAFESERVREPSRLITKAATEDSALLGFDFPIGLPIAYAQRASVTDFVRLLPELGRGEWADFFHPAESPGEITLRRPFYPQRPGGTSQQQLVRALGVRDMTSLLRRCELARTGRRAACALFWTLGGNQVGKGAISGWRDVLQPGLRNETLGLRIWPFEGSLRELLVTARIVLVETYPTEFYDYFGIRLGSGGKRSQSARVAQIPALLSAAKQARAEISVGLRGEIENGFGELADGEDRFDAVVGLFGMLAVLNENRIPEPVDTDVRRVEGWMFGQRP